MKIVNINYKGRVLIKPSIPISMCPPRQLIYHGPENMKLLVFSSGKCRLMGAKKPITSTKGFTIPFIITEIASTTVSMNIGQEINLHVLTEKLNKDRRQCTYEPEIFPALRLLDFNPKCVNVFASGKVMILGLKTLKYEKFCSSVKCYLMKYIYY